MTFAALSGWTSVQRSVVIASFLGWTLDAFDFFLMVFVLKDIAKEFGVAIPDVAFAILLTLAMRPLGAFLLERDVAARADNLGADLDQLQPTPVSRPRYPRKSRLLSTLPVVSGAVLEDVRFAVDREDDRTLV
jgi:hypothetical protein